MSKTGIFYDTIKFYCNKGLIPNVSRDQQNRRRFDEQDIAWMKSLSCLKKCGMSIVEMKQYVKYCQAGAKTIPERQMMLTRKLHDLQQTMAEITASMNFIKSKQKFYQDVLAGKREYYSNLVKKS